jgi:hypothetical protein
MKKDTAVLESSVDRVVSRLEDLEDKMVICENDVDIVKIQVSLVEQDIHMLEGSMGNVHKQLKNMGD